CFLPCADLSGAFEEGGVLAVCAPAARCFFAGVFAAGFAADFVRLGASFTTGFAAFFAGSGRFLAGFALALIFTGRASLRAASVLRAEVFFTSFAAGRLVGFFAALAADFFAADFLAAG